MVVLQLASSQFTPRVLGGFLQNRVVQSTLGIFVSTFVFALTVTRSVRGDYGDIRVGSRTSIQDGTVLHSSGSSAEQALAAG